jgi:3D (Asp-Asp-Asp) domain-containing protein
VAAVDPKVVDLGSRLWVEGIGEVVAADRGGGIKGNRIDIYMDKHGEAVQWGRKVVMVKIMD